METRRMGNPLRHAGHPVLAGPYDGGLPGGPVAWFGHPAWPWYRYLLGIDMRPEGFDPGVVFAPDSWSWLAALVLRFFRAVVVVALVEELFWRGYLMRLMVNLDHPWKIPFGTHSWKAYWVTTLCFMAVPACGLLRRLHLRFPGVPACRVAEKPVRRHRHACGGECAAGMGRAGMGQIRTVVNPAFTERNFLGT